MNEPLLRVEKLRKVFFHSTGLFRRLTGETVALDSISFTLHRGEVLGLVGESGSGKSTAGRAAIRLIDAEGSITFGDERLDLLSRRELLNFRPRAQMVFQDPSQSLNPRKTILESLGEPLLYHKRCRGSAATRDRIGSLLERVGLSADLMHRYPHQFSGGQQQRICIGRAISLDPELIICDEAVSALDLSIRSQILNLLLELKADLSLSLLFISHDLSVIRALCDRVLVLYQGRIVEEGPTQDLFDAPKHPYTKRLLAAIPCDHPSERRRRE